MSSSNKRVDCQNCESNCTPATLWCEKCDLIFCTNCFNSTHKYKAFSGHQSIQIDQRPIDDLLCAEHPKEKLTYWCITDEKLLCRSCYDINHRTHKIDTIEDASKLKEKQIFDKRTKIQNKLDNSLQQWISSELSCVSARTIVKETFQILRDKLNTKENELIEEIAAIEKKNSQIHNKFNNQIQTIRTRIAQLSREFDALLAPRNSTSIFEQSNEFNNKFDKIDIDFDYIAKPAFHKCSLRVLYEFQAVINEQLEFLKCMETCPYNISPDATWTSTSHTVIGDLSAAPYGLAIDEENGTVFVADHDNNRIVSWIPSERRVSDVVNNLRKPANVVMDKVTNSLIIAESGNKRVIRWSLQPNNNHYETVIDDVDCFGLAIDDGGALYVTDKGKHEVRRYPRGSRASQLVAGGNGKGSGLHQLNHPYYVTVDSEGSVYVAEWYNHRVVRWDRGAKEGILVAGFEGRGSKNTQLNYPSCVWVDANGNLYIVDQSNHRVIRYKKNETTADILIDKLNNPYALLFDREHRLYVADRSKCVLRFDIKH